MAHYFDDVFGKAASPHTPRTPGFTLRRSSTYGMGSAAINGARGNGESADGTPYGTTRRGSRGSVSSFSLQDPARLRERQEADSHLHSYITHQLENLRTDQTAAGYSNGEEFEAKA